MLSLIQKHAHVKGQRSSHHIFKFQPNPSWAKKRPNRYTSFVLNRSKTCADSVTNTGKQLFTANQNIYQLSDKGSSVPDDIDL